MNAWNSPSWEAGPCHTDTVANGFPVTSNGGGDRVEIAGDMSSSHVYSERGQSFDNDATCSYDDGEGVELNSIGTWNSEKHNSDNINSNGDIKSDNSNGEEDKNEEHEPVDNSDSNSDVIQMWSNPTTTSKRPPPPPSFAAPTLGSIASSLTLAAASYHSRTPSMLSWMSSHTSYVPWQTLCPAPVYLELPPHHVSTWARILPPDFFAALPRTPVNPPYHATARRTLILSLLNVWELTIEPSTGDANTLAELRTHIKKIAKDHIGHDRQK